MFVLFEIHNFLFIFSGANDMMVDEMERSIHDALCVVRRVMESKKVSVLF